MTLKFNTNGNEKQKLCAQYWLDSETIDIVYGGSKGSAKSYTGCSLIFGDALIYPETHYFIARKTLSDLNKHTRPSIHEVLNHWGVSESYYRFDGKHNYYELYNGSKVFLLDAKYLPSDPDYQRFGSMQITRGWIEEAGEFVESAKNNLQASIGRWKNEEYGLTPKLLQTCNPSKNYLYRNYYRPFVKGELPDWKKFVLALPTDNKMLPKDYVSNLMKILDKNQIQRLVFGNWDYDDDPTALCSFDDITAIFDNDHVFPGERFITADVARLGSDKAIILVWEGWVVIDGKVMDISRMTEIQDAINLFRRKYQIAHHKTIADEDGIGGGVVDNCGIKGFTNNARPFMQDAGEDYIKPNYNNLQSQCGYYLADKINDNAIYFKWEIPTGYREEIEEELGQLKTWKADTDGKVFLLPKEKIKENIGRSPDWRDVLLMRSYFDLDRSESEISVEIYNR